MKKFRLKPKVEAGSTGKDENLPPFGTIKDPRKRIQLALDELYQINTKAEINDALARGVEFSHEGFTRRIHVGTGTFRVSNSDLFEKLEERLLVLERIAGGPLRGQAAKRLLAEQKPGQKKKLKKKDVSAGAGLHKENDGTANADLQKNKDAELQKLRDEIRRVNQLLSNAQEEILDLTHKLSMALQLPNT
jgi:hypothetical protein